MDLTTQEVEELYEFLRMIADGRYVPNFYSQGMAAHYAKRFDEWLTERNVPVLDEADRMGTEDDLV